MDGVIERRPRTISFTARGGTPIARAIAFCEMLMGFKYSSRRISPGVIGGFMAITCSVMGEESMIIADGDFIGARIGPAKGDSPLAIDANGMKALEVTLEGFESVSGGNCEVGESLRMVHLEEFSENWVNTC